MKSLFFLLITSSFAFSQIPFTANTWASDVRFDENIEEITLKKIDTKNPQDSYYQLQFLPDNKFVSYNIPGCGLDCVVHVYGNYTTTQNTIQFITTRVERMKGCKGKEEIKKNVGTFYWIKEQDTYRLIKNFDDEPKENYFKKAQIEIPPVNNDKTQKILSDYEYVYNRIYQIWQNKNSKKYNILRRLEGKWLYNTASFTKEDDKNSIKLRQYVWRLDEILKKMIKDLEITN